MTVLNFLTTCRVADVTISKMGRFCLLILTTCTHAQHAISCDNTLHSDTDAYFISAAMLLITTKVSSMMVVACEAKNLAAGPLECSYDEASLSDVFSGQS